MTIASLSAVITGDLIHSRQASATQVDLAMDTLRDAAAEAEARSNRTLQFTRFRGDGWQIHLDTAGAALGTAVWLHAKLRATGLKIDTRMAVGIGGITSTGTTSLADASGVAFEISGQTLDTIGKRRITIAGTGVTQELSAIFGLVEHIIFDWTANQAEAAALALAYPDKTQEDIATKLGITRQAVQLRLAGAGAAPISAAVDALLRHDFWKAHIT
ncbi:hypothetical protein AB3Y40_09005 [Yoonia sp. R2331]|uniref:hypothetical protein n=1 Tax=Yoonia sp. R2331 TaxID=3237238 RepID=UPI0034E56AB1